MNNTCLKIAAVLLLACTFSGCGTAQPEMKSDGYSFGIGSGNYEDTFYCYRTKDQQTAVLDYDSMNTSLLCTKPNCNHTGDDCIVKRLNGNIPVFGDNCAYYFVDDEVQMVQNDEGKLDLLLGSNLCRYDFGTNQEKQLLHVDGACVGTNCRGLMLRNDVLYFVEDKLGRTYDSNGMVEAYGGSGGEMRLFSVCLSDMKITELCELYDVDELRKVYPAVDGSGAVAMQGEFDEKIYFHVGFMLGDLDDDFLEAGYYTTYYDLKDGTYHGTPEDYTKIDFARIMFLSDDYLVQCCKAGELKVYRKGEDTPVVLKDETYFSNYSHVCVFDDVLYCEDKAFDLNTKESWIPKALQDKRVVAKYNDYVILSESSVPGSYEKISANKLLK